MPLFVAMPRCETCQAYDPFRCRLCDHLTCRECQHLRVVDGEQSCAHYETQAIKSTGWTGEPLARPARTTSHWCWAGYGLKCLCNWSCLVVEREGQT